MISECNVTPEKIYQDFTINYRNMAEIKEDYRPYGTGKIRVWLKTGVSVIYDYKTRGINVIS